MANDFSRADVFAAWRFESGALDVDANALNALSLVNTPTEDTTNMMEGSCCMSLAAASSQYAKRADADLSAGFPLKSGDTSKIITVTCWVRPTTVDANKRVIWSKHKNETGKRCLALVHNSTQIYLRHNVTGATVTDLSMAFGPMTANQKYFIRVSVDGIGVGGTPVYWFSIFNVTAGTWYHKSGVTAAGSLSIGNADWRIGADEDLTANCYFDGQIDEVVVSNLRLHNSEMLAIKGGTFPVTGVNIYDYLYDPVSGNDTYDGFSSWGAAYKTLKKPFYPGDIIYGIKSPETPQAGTCEATQGSVTISTTNDLSAALPQYSIVRFDTDPTLYMIRSITSSAITLYRPYRGATGSGKTVNKMTIMAVANNDGVFTAYTGKKSSPILIVCGVNSSNNEQDGFTVVGSASTINGFFGGLTFVNATKLALYNMYAVFTIAMFDCELSDLLFFRISISVSNVANTRVILNRPIAEESVFPYCALYNCTINDPEICHTTYGGYKSGSYTIDTIISNLKTSGIVGASAYGISLHGVMWGVRFVSPVLDELGLGGRLISASLTSGQTSCNDVIIQNPTLGAGDFFACGGGTNPFTGEFNVININGSETNHRTIIGSGKSNSFYTLTPDYDVYHSAAPSAKITLPDVAGDGPYFARHHIPCEAGIEKTVSVYLRKNSYYGADTLPFMRLRWITGSIPNLVHNVHDVMMTNVDDTFQQVSYAVTPSVQGTIVLEVYFQSINAGALAWYDDIGVA